MASVTRYWCSIGTIGRSRPTSRPTSRAHVPAAFIDDLGQEVAPIGDDPPLAAGGPLDAGHPRVPVDPRAPVTRALDEGLGHARRVDVPVLRVPDRPQQAARLDERMQAPDLLGPDHLEREPDRPRLAPVAAVLVHPVRHGGEPEAPGPVEPDGLPGLRLESLVELRAGQVDPREVQARVEVRRVARRVPCRARGQLTPLDQDRIRPPGAREVVEDAGAEDAAADDDDPGRLGHGSASSGGSPSAGSGGGASREGGRAPGAAAPRGRRPPRRAPQPASGRRGREAHAG